MAAPVEFYFDFVSPFGYLASLRVDDLAARYGRHTSWQSMLIGVSIMKVMGLKPMLETPLKGAYLKHDLERYCRRHGIVLGRKPGESPPSKPLSAGRAFHWVNRHHPEKAKPLARAIFDAYWGNGRDISSPDSVTDIGVGVGLDRQALMVAMTGGEGADLLREAVDRSLAKGVFGSPYYIVDGEPFFGVEKMELLEEWLRDGGW